MTSKSLTGFRNAERERGKRTSKRRLALEPLEERRLLTVATVDTVDDVVDIGPSGTMADLPGADGVVSLREALIAANNTPGADEVQFDTAGVFATPQTVSLTLGQLEISDSVAVNGTGADNLTIDAQGSSRVLDIDDGVANQINVLLSGVTLTGGRTTGPSDGGGAIRSAEDLTVTESTVTGNSTQGENARGGGIFSSGTITLSDSTISDNSTSGHSSDGGGVYAKGTVTVTNSTITGNLTSEEGASGAGMQFGIGNHMVVHSKIQGNNSLQAAGGGILVDGGSDEQADTTILRSTISHNLSGFGGGGIWSEQGRLAVHDTTITENTVDRWGGGAVTDGIATFTNSTISGNIAGDGGGGIGHYSGDLIVRHSTITNNSSPSGTGSGILLNTSDENTSANVYSSIVSGNSNTDVDHGHYPCPTCSPYGDNPFTSGGFNVIGSGRAVLAFNNNDLIGVVDPMLGPLADHGGPTRTHAVLPGSPALDAGDPAAQGGVGDTPDFDQRGAPFSRVSGARIDIGAFEAVDGDFNNDGLFNCDDIDALVAEIAAGTNAPALDLTGDGLVDLSDLDVWLAEAGEVNLGPGKLYLLGDATLDGVVDGADFIAWNSNKFTSVGEWCAGDFNADGVVDGQDFIIWNDNKFQNSDGANQIVLPRSAEGPDLIGDTRQIEAKNPATVVSYSPSAQLVPLTVERIDSVFATSRSRDDERPARDWIENLGDAIPIYLSAANPLGPERAF